MDGRRRYDREPSQRNLQTRSRSPNLSRSRHPPPNDYPERRLRRYRSPPEPIGRLLPPAHASPPMLPRPLLQMDLSANTVTGTRHSTSGGARDSIKSFGDRIGSDRRSRDEDNFRNSQHRFRDQRDRTQNPRSEDRSNRNYTKGRNPQNASGQTGITGAPKFRSGGKKVWSEETSGRAREDGWGHSGFDELYPEEKRRPQNFPNRTHSPTHFRLQQRNKSRSRSPFTKRRSPSPRHTIKRIPPPSPFRKSYDSIREFPNPKTSRRYHSPSPTRFYQNGQQPKDYRKESKALKTTDDKRKSSWTIPKNVGSTLRNSPSTADGGKSFKLRSRISPVLLGENGKAFRPLSGKSVSSSGDGKSFRPSSGKPPSAGEGGKSFRPNSGKSSLPSLEGRKSSRPRSGKESSKFKDDGKRSRSSSSDLSSPNRKRSRRDNDDKSFSGSSTNSSSTEDEDVLEIHAKERRSLSPNSSSYDSCSDSDESVRRRDRSSSSASTESIPSSVEFQKNQKGSKAKTTERNSRAIEKKAAVENKRRTESADAKGTGGKETPKNTEVVEKKTSASSKKSIEKPNSPTAPTTTASTREKTPSSESSDSGDSDSSSSETDEPRMTLSERFAKLTQLSRDKREFAKPEISINDIDTKLKVVKDLRNADTKIILNQPASVIQRPPARLRPKSPEIADGEQRYDRKHFERMSRDEPREHERPNDWSDVRVRYNYYKNRGYFDERPLRLDEYEKWESWWYEYRDWLADEGYYSQPQQPIVSKAPERRIPPLSRNFQTPSLNRNFQSPSLNRNFQSPSLNRTFQAPPLRRNFTSPDNAMRRFRRDENPPIQHRRPLSRPPISSRIGRPINSVGTYNNQNNFRGRGRLAGRLGFGRKF